MTAWALHINPDGDRSLWHGDTEVARPGDLRVAHGYQQMLFDLLVAVLVQPPETVERVALGLHAVDCSCADYSGLDDEDQTYERQALAALGALAPPQDAVGHVAHAMRRLEHIRDHVAEEVDGHG